MRKQWTAWILLMGLIVMGAACAQTEQVKFIGGAGDGLSASDREALTPRGPAPAAAPVYTAYNMWYEKADNIYSTGYHVGAMLPAGTRVANVRLKRGVSSKIMFETYPGGKPYTIEFVGRHHPGLTIDGFCARYFTSKSLGELTEGFTEEEMKSVRQGTLRGRMSKRAVIVAYGYPIETYTPSLESNQWTFMRNRFNREVIEFDDNGYLPSIQTHGSLDSDKTSHDRMNTLK